MMTEEELASAVGRVEVSVLRRWVTLGWIVPEAAEPARAATFDDQDVARALLICNLVYECAVEEESVPIVLSLLDQLHDARRLLKSLSAAIDRQPDAVRKEIAAVLASARETR